MFLAQGPTDNVNIGSAKIVYIQPNADCSLRRKDAKADQLTNVRYFNYSPSDWYYLCLRNRGVRSNNTNPVFMTDSGYESCSCSRDIDNIRKKCNNTPVNDSCHRQRKTGRAMEHNQFEFIIEDDEECFEDEDDTFAMPTKEKLPPLTRSASCNSGRTLVRSSRRVSVLVDELLLKIYGGQTERRCSGGTDIHTFEGSTDSSNSFKSNSSLLKKKRSFSGIPEDKCRKWNNMVRTRLMHKSVTELKTLKATLEYNVSHAGSQLIRQLKRRDFLYSRRDAQCSIITAFLQAVSAKRKSWLEHSTAQYVKHCLSFRMRNDMRSFRKFITRGRDSGKPHDVRTRNQFLGARTARPHAKRNNETLPRTRNCGGVHWRLELPDRVPIETTVVQVEKVRRSREKRREGEAEDQRRISHVYVEYGDRNVIKQLRQPDAESYAFHDSASAQSSPRETEESHPRQRSPGHAESDNDSRAVKVRLNSAYRAKIDELGLAFVFALNAEEKMKMRRNRFRTNNEPVIPVQSTLASDLKGEFHNYCGRRKQPSWLYNIQ